LTRHRQPLRDELLELLDRLQGPKPTDVRQVHQLEISTSQFIALVLLTRERTATVSGIADHLRLSRGATSTLVEGLVRRQMVRRTEDPANRRQKRIEISSRGRRLIDDVDRMHQRAVEKQLASLAPSVRRKVRHHVRALIEILQEPHRRRQL
jgi:DNA-binding MarR family transcriptional regulator